MSDLSLTEKAVSNVQYFDNKPEVSIIYTSKKQISNKEYVSNFAYMYEYGLRHCDDHANQIIEGLESIFSRVRRAVEDIFDSKIFRYTKNKYALALEAKQREYVISIIKDCKLVESQIRSLDDEWHSLKNEESPEISDCRKRYISKRISEIASERMIRIEQYTRLSAEKTKYEASIKDWKLDKIGEIIDLIKESSDGSPEAAYIFDKPADIRRRAETSDVMRPKKCDELQLQIRELAYRLNVRQAPVEENHFNIGSRSFFRGQKIFYKNQKGKTGLYRILGKSEDRIPGLMLESYDGHRRFAISGKRLCDVFSSAYPDGGCSHMDHAKVVEYISDT